MTENLEEKFIEERLKHEKSERDLFEQLQKLTAENEKLKEMMFVAESALMKQNKIYRQVLHDIEEIINNFAGTDIITLPDLSKEKNYKLIAEQYAEPIKQIIQKIKELNNV